MDAAENDRPKVEEYEVYHYLTNIDQLYRRTSQTQSRYSGWIHIQHHKLNSLRKNFPSTVEKSGCDSCAQT